MKIGVEQGSASRLVLGTAQLGMPYGVANRTGQPDIKTAIEIIKAAWEKGIREFDTAQAYGDSETVLGRALASLCLTDKARIITKLDPNLDHKDKQCLEMAVGKSLSRLQVSSLYGLMLHREAWLDDRKSDLGDMLRGFLRERTVQHIGVSLYSPKKALQALRSEVFDMIQVPANILDSRFTDAGVFGLAEEKEKQIYVRSVFLQGLLLMKPENLPQNMIIAKPVLTDIDDLCKEYKCTRQQMALGYVKQKYRHAKIVFGAETVDQVEQNTEDWQKDLSGPLMKEIWTRFSRIDEGIIDPTRWSH